MAIKPKSRAHEDRIKALEAWCKDLRREIDNLGLRLEETQKLKMEWHHTLPPSLFVDYQHLSRPNRDPNYPTVE